MTKAYVINFVRSPEDEWDTTVIVAGSDMEAEETADNLAETYGWSTWFVEPE